MLQITKSHTSVQAKNMKPSAADEVPETPQVPECDANVYQAPALPHVSPHPCVFYVII